MVPRKPLALLAFAALGVATWRHTLSPSVAVAYAATSLLALLLYARDKTAARRGRGRTRERTLHAVALLGGWPGALLAQDLFRHKTSKTTFQATFWCTVAVNCAGMAWWLHATGR